MDPNANVQEQEQILRRRATGGLTTDPTLAPRADDAARLTELRQALRQWIDRGGFEPDWDQAPHARQYYGR